VLFDELWGRPYGQSGVFAICGPPSPREPLVQRPTADVPLFVGPATLSLSGQRGRYAWDEVHFGADRVMVATTASAGQEPCATYLELDDRSGAGGVLSSGMLMAGAGEEANRKAAVEVDYATAGLRVGSTCPDWSVTFEPLEDPGLPYRVTERYYPVQGQTIEELASQAGRAKDGWTAYAGWHTDWRFWWQEAAHSCDLTHGDVDLQARITYPRWRQPDDAAPATVARWERFMRNLRTHEMGHITIALQGADAIDELLDGGLSGPDCEQLERLADRAAERLHDRYERLNDRYDEATDHGLAQGTGLP
jgi:predicted secreted Zn-dependent protease